MKWSSGFETYSVKQGKTITAWSKPYFMVMCDGGAMAGL
jgi:hypothetical protein